jgi:hypothetical protein
MDVKKRLARGEYKGGGTWVDAHWRTICGNLIHEDGEVRKARPEDKVKIKRNQALCIHDDVQFLNHRGEEEGLNRSAMVHIAVAGALSERRAFITKDGFLSLGPEGLRIGDHVFILSGSNVPFALGALDKKKTGELKTQYRLVGDCYVHGIMNGEMYENP